MNAVDVVTSVALVVSVSFVLLAAVGLHRFDDVFSRVHAATKAVTLGVVLAAGGAALQMNRASDMVKLLLVVVLQLISAPVSAHMLGRATYWNSDELSPETLVDELAESKVRLDDPPE